MNDDDFERRVGTWLRERAIPDPIALTVIRGSIEVLPPRRTGRRLATLLASAAVLAILVVGAVGVVLAPGPGGSAPRDLSQPVPPDPAAFAGDPRLASCMGAAGRVEFAFEMPHARDYQRHFPAMLLSPELDVEAPGFVVVFASGADIQVGGGASAPTSAPASPSPGTDPRSVCIQVGDTPNLYRSVDVSGMRVDLGDADGHASSTPSGSPPPESVSPTEPTDAPAPAWVADLLGQLACDGPPQAIGGETGEVAGEAGSTVSPEAAMESFLTSNPYASIPVGGFGLTDREGHYARFAYTVGGRVKAIVIVRDQGPDQDPDVWTPVGLRACDPSEFVPGDGLSFDQTLWLDGNGVLERADRIHSTQGPEHCGWQSAVFLRFEGIQYIRDPSGVLADATIVAFDPDAALPDGARDTGLHTNEWRLFVRDDADAVWIRTTDGSFERWGRARDEVGCM